MAHHGQCTEGDKMATTNTKSKAVVRRNGYYQHPDNNLYYPAVSSITKSVGDSGGLLQWAAKMGARRVVQVLGRVRDLDKLQNKLQDASAIDWADGEGSYGLKNATKWVRDYGTAVHGAIEEYLKKGKVTKASKYPDWDERHDAALDTFKSFYEEVGLIADEMEKEVFNTEVGYAGRLDILFRSNGLDLDKLQPYVTGNIQELAKDTYILGDIKTGRFYYKEHLLQLCAYTHAVEEYLDKAVSGAMVINIDRDDPTQLNVYWFNRQELDEAYEVVKYAQAVWKYFKAPKWWKEQTVA